MRVAFAFLVFLGSSLALAKELTVLAASSLTEAFTEIASAFEAQHQGVRVLLSFGGSSVLATQVARGIPADVFASANETQMQVVVDNGVAASTPQVFTGNRLVVITPRGSPLTRLEHLAGEGISVVLAAPGVPAGDYARAALTRMNGVYGADFSERVLANVVSEEPNVRQVALKVELGQADAAIVYATDATAFRNLDTLAIPDAFNVSASYLIARLAGAPEPELAQAFIALVVSAEGRAILGAKGFQAPEHTPK